MSTDVGKNRFGGHGLPDGTNPLVNGMSGVCCKQSRGLGGREKADGVEVIRVDNWLIGGGVSSRNGCCSNCIGLTMLDSSRWIRWEGCNKHIVVGNNGKCGGFDRFFQDCRGISG